MSTGALTRRDLLLRGAGFAILGGAGSLATFDRLADDAPPASSLRKCISLGGPGSLRMDGHPDDYLAWGNREYIRDASRTTWVKLWVSWYDLQQELGAAPASRAASWSHLNTAPGGQSWLRRLDRQLKAINDDGLGSILTLYQTFPTWANGATGNDPVGGRRPPERKLPLDLSTNGPWGWFVGYLVARYRRGAAVNPVGPHEPAAGEDASLSRFGNPDGGAIDALEVCNEPNQLYWPQKGIAAATAQMIRSGTSLSRTWGGTPILGPATGDFPDHEDNVNRLGIVDTQWESFTRDVLSELHDFRPPVPFHWSHHNYRETRVGEAPRRSLRVLRLLRQMARWRLDPQPLWLTEGGYDMGSHYLDPSERDTQARQIERGFRSTMGVRDVFMWTQHTISDKQGNNWKGGLRDDFVWGQGPGEPRLAWYAWRDVPGVRRS